MCFLVLYKGSEMTALGTEVASLPSSGQKTGSFGLCFIQAILHVSYSCRSVSNQPKFAVSISWNTLKMKLKVEDH